MTGVLARLVVIAALAAGTTGCDVLDFVAITEPGPPPTLPPGGPGPAPPDQPLANIQIRYLLQDSLRGFLRVELAGWTPSGAALDVRLDGRSVPQAADYGTAVHFEASWTLAADELGSLPQILTIPKGEEIVRVAMPALVRETTGGVVYVDSGDVVLDHATVGDSTASWRAWQLAVVGGDDGFSMHGPDAPPDPLRIPRELLPDSTTTWTAHLHASAHRMLDLTDATLVLVASAEVDWALVSTQAASQVTASPGQAVAR